MIWLCITLVLSVASVNSGQNVNTSHIRVFPAMNQSIAGVFQVSYLNHQNQPQYAFNASEARRLCSSLGVNIASKAEVQEALARGFETCRFGWVDEHLAVIPRIKALSNCGQNHIGLLTWRARVTQAFDVFCFNESDVASQLKNIATDSPLSSRDYSSPPEATNSTQTTGATSSSHHPSSSSALKTIDKEAEPARFVGAAQGSGAKAILITSTCALLLIAIIIAAYLKLQRSCSWKSDKKQQQEYIEAEECVKSIKENQKDAQQDERIEVGDNSD